MELNPMMNQPIVIDNDSDTIKEGFDGDEEPKCITSNYVGSSKYPRGISSLKYIHSPFKNSLAMSIDHKSRKIDDDKAETIITFKAGYLNRKRIFEAGGKPTVRGRRSWRRVYVILQDLRIKMRNGIHEDDIVDTKTPANQTPIEANELGPDDRPIPTQAKKQATKKIDPTKTKKASNLGFDIKSSSKIHHSLAHPASNYEKREFVFHLRLADRSEFLLQANNEQDMLSWVESINFASACLSAPALASAISNNIKDPSSKSKQPIDSHNIQKKRPILPASYTKLSYWEQLLDHELRFQRLKHELEELLKEAPNTRNANKRFKTQFIHRIGNLKEDIERYGIYVDLMRKKSNSHEAMILSKHANIVSSLDPSNEMMMHMPLK